MILANDMESNYDGSTLDSVDMYKGMLMQSTKDYQSVSVSLEDFEIEAVIGRGSFGKVYSVRKKDDQKHYAMKTLKKDMILRKNQTENTRIERMILERISHPFIVKLHYAF